MCGAVYLSPLYSTIWNGDPPEAEYAQEVTVDVCILLHPQLDMTVSQDKSYFPNIFCCKNGMRKLLSQRPVFLTGTDHDKIIDEMSRGDKLEYECDVNCGIGNDSYKE